MQGDSYSTRLDILEMSRLMESPQPAKPTPRKSHVERTTAKDVSKGSASKAERSPSKILTSPIRKRTTTTTTTPKKANNPSISPSKLPDLAPFTIGRTPHRQTYTISSPTPTPTKLILPTTTHAATGARGGSGGSGRGREIFPLPSPSATPARNVYTSPSPRKEVIEILSSSPELSPGKVGEWGDEDSDSDELISPRRMLEFLRAERTGGRKGEGRGGFRESLGGTVHEVDE